MILFQLRQGVFGGGGWINVPFWKVWLPTMLFGPFVSRIIIGTADSISEMNAKGYNWFDKRVPRDLIHELSMWDTRLDLLDKPSDLIKAYKQEKDNGNSTSGT